MGTHKLAQDFFDRLEKISYDYRYLFKYIIGKTWFVPKGKSKIEGVTIVDIDERSMAKLGPYHKWPRSYHGKVVDELTLGGGAGVVFDIVFKTADFGRKSTDEIINILTSTQPETDWGAHRAHIRQGLNYDSILVASVERSGIVIAAAWLNNENMYPNKSDWEHLATEEWHRRLNPGSSADLPCNIIKHFETKSIFDNIFEELARASARIGLVNVVPEADGVHRTLPLFYNYPNLKYSGTNVQHTYAATALQTSLFLLGKTLNDIEIVPGEYVNLGAPLRIMRKHGRLTTSFPKLSFPMVEQILAHKEELLSLGPDNPTTVTVSNPVIIRRTLDNQLEIEISEGQFLTEEMVSAIRKTATDTVALNRVTEDNPLMLNETMGFFPSEEEGLYFFRDMETEEEIYFDAYTLHVIKNHWPQKEIAGLIPGRSVSASGYLTIGYDGSRDNLVSPIIILTRDVVHSLLNTPLEKMTQLAEGRELDIGRDIRIPIDGRGRMLINYQGEGKTDSTFRYMSYYDVVAKRKDPTTYQGRVFILGSSAPALFDIVSSTFDESYPGIEIHATAIHNILTNTFMRRLTDNRNFSLLLLIGLVTGLLVYLLPLRYCVLLVLVCGIGYTGLAYAMFENNWWLEIVRPELTLFGTLILVLMVRYMFEERDKRFLNDAFKNYISPELIDLMVESGSRPSLGGSEATLTAYFTDIQSFSTFSEKLGSPTKLVELLNEYLSEMTDILINNQGTLDKYEGDAIIAFFGAPVKLDDHQLAAARTALAMQAKLGELRAKWRSEGGKWPEIVHHMRMRIGINTGSIVTGNMGSRMRMNYTMMGDAVNLAARLESGAKQYGAFTLASAESLEGIQDRLLARELDLIKVVGKSEPVRVYELLALRENATADLEKCAALFQEGLARYRAQQWEEAERLFRECLAYEPHHPEKTPGCKTTPSHVFLERCFLYKTDRRLRLPEDWDGVFSATEK